MSRLIPTRWSHLLGYSSVGALVRAENDLFVVMDISRWTDRQGQPGGELLHYVDLLRATLAIDSELRQPPLARELPNGAVDGTCVPALRFPRWTRCPSCGLMHFRPWGRNPDESPGVLLRCGCEKRSRLQQVAWVVVHPDGGMEEVPWHFLAHSESNTAGNCRQDYDRTYLRLRRDAESARHWLLTCDRCGARARFDQNRRLDATDSARQPWERFFDKNSPIPSQQKALILEVNDLRVYLPRASSALVIPPESRIQRGSVLDLLYCNHGGREALQRCRSPLQRNGLLRKLADQYRTDVPEVKAAWEEIDAGWPLYGQSVTPGELMVKEFHALSEPVPDLADGEDFVPHHKTDAWQVLGRSCEEGGTRASVLSAVDRLVALVRLREVRIFTGFTRVTQNVDDGLNPTIAQSGVGDEPVAKLVPPDLDGSQDWLPAIELYGEGIFFTIDEKILERWSRQPGLQKRTELLQRRFERTGLRFPDLPPLPLTPRFFLLHTLAHLLIRQLETQAGYPAASIRERIYCGQGEGRMAGILVYVAVPDVVGSLGGLAELAEPERFLRLLTSVFDHADWCSLDPVCGEHEGQGPSQLNLAACHACALVPETACMFGNVLLDRTFVRGDLQGEVRGILDFAEGASS